MRCDARVAVQIELLPDPEWEHSHDAGQLLHRMDARKAVWRKHGAIPDDERAQANNADTPGAEYDEMVAAVGLQGVRIDPLPPKQSSKVRVASEPYCCAATRCLATRVLRSCVET